MATTRIIKHHISTGQTIAASLADRFGYGQNLDKTDNGELIRAYACDHETADAEFTLSKAQYHASTGRKQERDADVLCYQIRQSFKPGEVTAEQANAIGYDFALRWTKGRYAFFVATHTDRSQVLSFKRCIKHLLIFLARPPRPQRLFGCAARLLCTLTNTVLCGGHTEQLPAPYFDERIGETHE